ncbi:MAG: ATP-binding cassette domain-containing protein [bacterium]|nr:ATP-binding cassette domain-containing protein [bacterium]
MIEFFNVSKVYPGNRVALSDVTLRIDRGQFAVLAGSSGAGKSTLLRLIYRAAVPTEGQILVNGRNVGSLPGKKVPYLRRTMGVVFQDFSLIERKTVLDNVTFLPRILGVDARSRRQLAEQTLERVGLESHLDSYPAELSGGEQQRVAIARAVINKPDLVLADEPTGNLDPHLSRGIMHLFAEIHREGATILLASHDPELRREFGERLLVLDEGRLITDKELARSTSSPNALTEGA